MFTKKLFLRATKSNLPNVSSWINKTVPTNIAAKGVEHRYNTFWNLYKRLKKPIKIHIIVLIIISIIILISTQNEYTCILKLGERFIIPNTNKELVIHSLEQFNNKLNTYQIGNIIISTNEINEKVINDQITQITSSTEPKIKAILQPYKKYVYTNTINATLNPQSTGQYLNKSHILSNIWSDIYVAIGNGSISDGWQIRLKIIPNQMWLWLLILLLIIVILY